MKLGELEYRVADFFTQEINRLNKFFEEFDRPLDDYLFNDMRRMFDKSFHNMFDIAKVRIGEKERANKMVNTVKEEYKKYEEDKTNADSIFYKGDTNDPKNNHAGKLDRCTAELCGDPNRVFRDAVNRVVAKEQNINKWIDAQDSLAKHISVLVRGNKDLKPGAKDAAVLLFKTIQFVRMFFGETLANDYKKAAMRVIPHSFESDKLSKEVDALIEKFNKENAELLSKFSFGTKKTEFGTNEHVNSSGNTVENGVKIGDGNFTLSVTSRDIFNDGKVVFSACLSLRKCCGMLKTMDVTSRTKLGDMVRFVTDTFNETEEEK